MNRNQNILKYITKKMVGVEVAPYHKPFAPKSEGFNFDRLKHEWIS